MELFANYLKSSMPVNQSYAAACIEKMLIKKSLAPGKQDQTVLNNTNVDQNMLSSLLQNLCEMLNENKDLYAIRALLRVIQLSQQNLIPFAATLGDVL